MRNNDPLHTNVAKHLSAHWPKVIIALLLILILGVPFALRPSAPDGAAGAKAKLIILTPNNAQIRYEFSHGFNRWREKHHLPQVTFDWRASGGTSDLIKIVLSTLRAKAEAGKENQGVGADLFFGGGAFNQDKLARGITVMRNGKKIHISAIVPAHYPDGFIKKVFPQPAIAGAPLYNPNLLWVGTALASFGIVYNRDLLKMLDLPEPKTWADLANPKYLHEIALADPAHSGAIAETYDIIVRRLGWVRGWQVLKRIFANTRSFSAGSSNVPVEVSQGQAAAGMCIDFYGRYQAGAVGGNRVGYIDPPGMTAVTADPISLLRGAPHKKVANQFILWILSKPAQRLWQQKTGTPGGPLRYQLRRQPVRKDLYTPQEKKYWTDPQIDPFTQTKPLPDSIPDYYAMIAPLSHAMAIDVHQELTAAWQVILSTPKHSAKQAKMVELFNAMPEELSLRWPTSNSQRWRQALTHKRSTAHNWAKQILNGFWGQLTNRYKGPNGRDTLLKDQQKWTQFFRSNYQKIIALGKR